MAQQASPNVIHISDPVRAQVMRSSAAVTRNPLSASSLLRPTKKRSSAPTGWPVLTLTNDGLVGFRRVGRVQGAQLVPDLAVALPTPTDGGKTYTLQVRRGIHYSNGKLVQPDDFRRAIERLFEIDLADPAAAVYFSGVVGTERCAVGKACDLSRGIVTDRGTRTVTFHLKAPDADFLAKLALPPAFAVAAGTPAHDVGVRPIPATGP